MPSARGVPSTPNGWMKWLKSRNLGAGIKDLIAISVIREQQRFRSGSLIDHIRLRNGIGTILKFAEREPTTPSACHLQAHRSIVEGHRTYDSIIGIQRSVR